MHIVIAPNSFKHCLSAPDVACAMAEGVTDVWPDADIALCPMADGGDGVAIVLAHALGGQRVMTDTVDPLGRPHQAEWLKTEHWAVIEMALASGIALLQPRERRPLLATTRGTGILIRAALDAGCRDIIMGLGGSATVEAGCGMAMALGFRLLKANGDSIDDGGDGVGQLDRIDIAAVDSRLRDVRVTCLSDVQNPLLGSDGAACVYGPQKGASPEEVDILERHLARWADVVQRDLGVDVRAVPGAGAAGGLGAGCLAFLNARLEGGAAWIAAQIGLESAIQRADLVLTGEGRIDHQTAFGKVPALVGQLALTHKKPAVALGGSVEKNLDLTSIGLTQCLSITPVGCSLDKAIQTAAVNLRETTARFLRGWEAAPVTQSH